MWDLGSGQEVRTLAGHKSWVWGVAVTPEGEHAVSASHDKTLKLWDLRNGACLATFTADTGVLACAVAPDGKAVVAGDRSGTVHFLRLDREEVIEASWRVPSTTCRVAMAPAYDDVRRRGLPGDQFGSR